MQFLTLKIAESRYALLLEFLQTLSYVEIIKSKPPKAEYDFSDLVGKLQWKGNAMDEQRLLRDEW